MFVSRAVSLKLQNTNGKGLTVLNKVWDVFKMYPHDQKKNKWPLHSSLVQDTWELQEQNDLHFIPKMKELMYCYQSVYEM